MNDKITIQELAAYLPWEVEAIHLHRDITVKILGLQLDLDVIHSNGKTPIQFIKPILYTLSSLTKEIEHKGKKFVPIDYIADKYYTQNWVSQLERCIEDERWVYHLDYSLVLHLLEWHMDIFGLLDRGLAVDKTTIL